MNTKKYSKILREIEETSHLIDYLLHKGVDFEGLCACLRSDCVNCLYYDHNFFSEKKVRESREWNGNIC